MVKELVLPNTPPQRRKTLARAMFSAVHGIVSLGLVEKLGALTLDELHWQVRVVLAALLKGLQDDP